MYAKYFLDAECLQIHLIGSLSVHEGALGANAMIQVNPKSRVLTMAE